MIIFLYGKDTFRLKEKREEIIKKYTLTKKSGISLKFFDFLKDGLSFFDEISQNLIFREKKLLVLSNLFSSKEAKERFEKEKDRLKKSDDIILVYEERELPENDNLFRFLKLNSKVQKFDLLDGEKLKIWVKDKFKKERAEIEEKALHLLCEYVGDDLWRMSNEIKKLLAWKKDTGEKITSVDVKLLVKPKIDLDIFKTIDAIAEGKKALALELVHKHLEKGDSPLYLLAMINFQIRNLITVKELTEKGGGIRFVTRQSNLSPFLARKMYFLSKRFGFEELKKIYRKILKVDFQIKTGKLKPDTAIEILVAEI